jgi:hypothetical protein
MELALTELEKGGTLAVETGNSHASLTVEARREGAHRCLGTLRQVPAPVAISHGG